MAKLALLGQNNDTGSLPMSVVSVSFDGNSASLNDEPMMLRERTDENNYSLYHNSSIYDGAGTSTTSAAAARKAKEQMVKSITTSESSQTQPDTKER